MIKVPGVVDRFALRVVWLITVPLLFLTVSLLLISLRSLPESVIRFVQPQTSGLAAGSDIAGQTVLDKDSYFLGQRAHVSMRIQFRKDMVVPDFEAFKRDMVFFPFDQTDFNEKQTDIGNGITEYTADYILHVIGVRKPGSYSLKPAVLSYSKLAETGSNLHTLRIPRPEVHIASYYPANAGGIPLRGIRQRIFSQDKLRQTVMSLGGVVTLAMAIYLLWRFGRRRGLVELTEPEQLWHQFRQLNLHKTDNRAYLLGCERIFTRLLHLQTGMDPDEFWKGIEIADPSWGTIVSTAREVFRHVYQAGGIPDEHVHKIKALLEERLAVAVEQPRLELEQQPALTSRILQQRNVAATIGILLAISILMLVMAVLPDLWLDPQIKRYNESVMRIQSGHAPVEDTLLDLQGIAGAAHRDKIRAAALYNSGTTRAAYSFGEVGAAAQSQILDMIFQAESADALLQTLILSELSGSEEEVVTMFISAAERLLQSELDLQAAARIQNDEDILRNLELVTKRRHAILTRLVQLRDLFKMNAASGTEQEMVSDQGMVNVIDAKLPEEYEDAEMAKDNSSYIIFERF